jgi:Zn-dependent metalloprotease
MVPLVAFGAAVATASAQPARLDPQRVRLERSATTGLITFVAARDGGSIPVEPVPGRRVGPADFLHSYGSLFGVTDAGAELVQTRARADHLGHVHTRYEQLYRGVPVFGGVLYVHQAADGSIRAANGDFFPIPRALDATPTLAVDDAVAIVRAKLEHGRPTIEHAELVIVDPGWYGDPPIGPHLAYYIVLTDLSVPVREAFFVGAHKGSVLDRWTLLERVRDREVFDDAVGLVVRTEGDPPTGDADSDSAYDYSGDFYDFLDRAFARDSYDDGGGTLNNIVNLVAGGCPNAFGGGGASFFCTGTATDDIVAHEWGHSLTSWTADLIYQNQPGQLNESYSDIWGELIDLFNGDVSEPGPPGGTPWPTAATYMGSGTDIPNALRSGCVSETVVDVLAPLDIAGTYSAQAAAFGLALTVGGTSGDVVVAAPFRACSPLTNAAEVNGKIALIERGQCTFTSKVKNAQDAGAIAAIVYNNLEGGPAPMGGTDGTITIPSVGLTKADGELIRDRAETETVSVTLRSQAVPSIRWLLGEDSAAFGGAIRDMWEPTCAGDPDRANHPLQVCNPDDNGGVHSGSGIPNHAFAIMTDGKTFNGFTVNAIGAIKAAAVWYRALSVYLTPISNFQDAYVALTQAANDLVDDTVVDPRDGVTTLTFTAADAVEVDKALQAVEMNTAGLCGSWKTVLDSTAPSLCSPRLAVYADDFESGVNGWSVFNSGPPTPYDWVQVSGGLPMGRSGTVWFAEDRHIGNCSSQDESAVHSLLSPVIALPADVPSATLSFTHFVDSETFFDGGIVNISVDAGPFTQIPATAIVFNGYNSRLSLDNTNPLAGRDAWTGVNLIPGVWGTTLIDLSGFVTGGESVQFLFQFGKDGCTGTIGWFVDDFELLTCPTTVPPDPEDQVLNRFGAFATTILSTAGGPAGDTAMRVELVKMYHSGPADACVSGPNDGSVCTGDADCPDGLCVEACPPRTAPLSDLSVFEGQIRWLGPAFEYSENTLPPIPNWIGAKLECTPELRDWSQPGLAAEFGVDADASRVYFFGAETVPCSVYAVRQGDESCIDSPDPDACLTPPLLIKTSLRGDVVAPIGLVNFQDISALVNKFKGLTPPDAPREAAALLRGNVPGQITPGVDTKVGFLDIGEAVNGYKTIPYGQDGPSDCP